MQETAMALIEQYGELFVQRWNQYAVQQRDGSYVRVAEPLTYELLVGHLLGRWTLGTYLLDEQSLCSFAVFDADSEGGLEVLVQLARRLSSDGVSSLLEASRRGGHLWVHLAQPTPARWVRTWLLPYAVEYGLELYPKQDMLAPGGSGSLIRLPLGIHRRSRGWYPFLEQVDGGVLIPVGQTQEACCLWAVEHVQRQGVPGWVMEQVQQEDGLAESTALLPAEDNGVLVAASWCGSGGIRAWCRSQDIKEVIGRYVVLDRAGVGSCPFKEHHVHGDVHPSFQVFGGVDPHWYCYTWGRAGNVFDFLCHYHHLTAQEGWERLKRGELC